MSSDESKRRKDICVECGRYMPIKAKNKCQACHVAWKFHNIPDFFLKLMYTRVKQRCTNPNDVNYPLYAGKLDIDREVFLDKFKNDNKFLKYYLDWQNNGYDYALTPSIDRINVQGKYSIDNIQIIPHGENTCKDKKIPVEAWDKHGNYLGQFESATFFAEKYKVQQANVWKVIHGKRKHTEGYKIKYV